MLNLYRYIPVFEKKTGFNYACKLDFIFKVLIRTLQKSPHQIFISIYIYKYIYSIIIGTQINF